MQKKEVKSLNESSYLTTLSIVMEIIKLKPIKEKDYNPNNCPVYYTMKHIGGTWKPEIIWAINFGINRFSLLLRELDISRKMLSKKLKELEESDILVRTSYPEVPPRVVYSFSTKGKSVIPLIHHMCDWGEANMHS